jgi:TolB-like protein/Tfp pilus assembly protein PilF
MAERRLESWKEIGAYLGRSARTVQRWERLEGLPVHRLQHEKLGNVYAFASELDAWWESRRTRLGAEPATAEPGGADEPAAAPVPAPAAGTFAPRRRSLAALAGLVALLAAVAAWLALRAAPARIVRLAVLPLENLGAAAEDYLSDGLTEELISVVSQVDPERLRVMARTSVMRFKGTRQPIAAIGRELGVDYVIEGSLRRSGDRFRLTAQLIRVSDETHLWADSFDTRLDDVLRVQAELATRVAREVRVSLTATGRARLAVRSLPPAAHEAYLRARHFVARGDPDDMRRAVSYFEQAAELAPDFAAAPAGIAEAYVGLAGFGYGGMRSTEAIDAARAAARRALEIDPESADAHAALGSVLFFGDWDWDGARGEYDRAVALDPGDPEALHARSLLLMARGDVEAGLADVRRALERDPLSPAINRACTTHLYFARRYDAAVVQGKKALELEPTDTGALDDLAELYWQRGEWGPFFETFQTEADLSGIGDWVREAREAHGLGGPKAMVAALLARFNATPQPPSPFLVAELYARAGDVEPALEWLEKALEARAAQMVYVSRAPYFEALHGQPRFEAIVRRVGPKEGRGAPSPRTEDQR